MRYSTAKKIRRAGAAAVLGGAALIGASLYRGEHVPEAVATGAALAATGAAARGYARRSYERGPSNWGWAPRFGMNYYDINRLGRAAVLGGVGIAATGLAAGDPQTAHVLYGTGAACAGAGIAAFARAERLHRQDERALDAFLDKISGAMERQRAWRERQAGGSQ